MAQRVQTEVMNGHPQAQRRYQAPPEPQQVLLMPQQQMIPQMPQIPVLSPETFAQLQQFGMSLQALPVLIPMVIAPAMQFAHVVANQMDEISNFVEGEEEIDLSVNLKY